MKIGLPRALYYYRYRELWETFFRALSFEVVRSPKTDRHILARGMHRAIDESCLSAKVYLGHVEALLGHCDAIFVPRIAGQGRGKMLCTRFEALYDLVANTFREEKPSLLTCNIDGRCGQTEQKAFLSLGRSLGMGKRETCRAYAEAKQAEQSAQKARTDTLFQLFEQDGLKILLVGHSYNLCDPFIGAPISDYLKKQGAVPIAADLYPRDDALSRSAEVFETMPWFWSRELSGAVYALQKRVDGIIYLSAFPCGPDSMVNEMLLRRVRGVPSLLLTLDSQDASAGIETRLESFLDIISFQKEAGYHAL